jgi:hypothetical protein
MNIPQKIPQGVKRIRLEKKTPPEFDWIFITTYENTNKQQVVFNQEPHRNIRCTGDKWQENLSVFKPTGSSEGCSFYIAYLNKENKTVRLHWFLWNINNTTYAIYDRESILSKQESMDLAESIKPEIVIAKDLTNKK